MPGFIILVSLSIENRNFAANCNVPHVDKAKLLAESTRISMPLLVWLSFAELMGE